jgi:uncharacterized protein YrrD
MDTVAGSRLQGLPVVSLEDASIVGHVAVVVLADDPPRVAGFLLGVGLYEARLLRFDGVHAVGGDAVVVACNDDPVLLSSDPAFEALVERRLDLEAARAVTLAGSPAGTVRDYYVDTETGDLMGLVVATRPGPAPAGPLSAIPMSHVRRVRDLVVLEDDYALHTVATASALPRRERTQDPAPPPESRVAPGPQELPPAPGSETTPQAPASDEAVPDAPSEPALPEDEGPQPGPAPAEPVSARHFLLGRKVLRRIETPAGHLIADEGDAITSEMIREAREADLLLLLSLNTE